MTTLTLTLTLRPYTTLDLTLSDHHDAFESFCVRYSMTLYGTIPAPSTVQWSLCSSSLKLVCKLTRRACGLIYLVWKFVDSFPPFGFVFDLGLGIDLFKASEQNALNELSPASPFIAQYEVGFLLNRHEHHACIL